MRHHYVPEFLLSPWAASSHDKKLEAFRLDLGHIASDRHPPKYVGYEDDLYALSLPVVAGMEQQAVEEHFLKHVDNLAARVRRKLCEQGLRALTWKDRMDWTRFLMSLRLRQPSLVRMLRDESAAHLRETLAAQPEQYEELVDVRAPPTLEEWTEQRFPGLIKNCGMSFFHKLVDAPRIGDRIVRMRWWLWDFSHASHDLLIADRPCIFTAAVDDMNLIIALPISPRKAFMATQSNKMASILRQQEAKNLVVRLNESSLVQASARIYARNDSPRRFIENRISMLRTGR